MDTLLEHFSVRCLSIDLEVDRKTEQINSLGAIRHDTNATLSRSALGSAKRLNKALAELDRFAEGAEFLLGHNLIDFDLIHLQAANPKLALLRLPAIDTLWLNPLAFPRNPYHHLVKHYKDPRLLGGQRNDPKEDCKLAKQLLDDQQKNFLECTDRSLLDAWHWLATARDNAVGFDAFFQFLRGNPKPSDDSARNLILEWLAQKACRTHCIQMIENAATLGWGLSFALAWISVSGGNSVMPPWVFHKHPEAARLVRKLRDTACGQSDCGWCCEHHNPVRELKRWFGFPGFRPEPKDPGSGRPMQEIIVESSMSRKHVLGILPTGTGKSLCYQLPALSRYYKTGALTVVISPLVALMADQVDGMERSGIISAVTINGMLSLPERRKALDRVRLGDASIMIISPEQLRSVSVRNILKQRQIGAWVIDEAHCLSKWGHDFRPDYRYLGRFICEYSTEDEISPILALTATAKPEVKDEIVRHFQDKLGIEMLPYDGGSGRDNLKFAVIQTDPSRKREDVYQILHSDLLGHEKGSAIVYCAFRRHTEDMADFLNSKGVPAAYFHSKLTPDRKKTIQDRFISGEIRVIVATNAFGMGIDKPDVRLVIHADIPGSLENYIQEAGRAGRDRDKARCVLLFTMDDVEKQFGMSARSRLSRQEIAGILRALKNIDYKNRKHNSKHKVGEVVVTSGEILLEDDEKAFERDEATDDTRVKTAISWLEDAVLLSREENRVQVYASSLLVGSVEEAQKKIDSRKELNPAYRQKLLDITRTLIQSDPDEGISTDELMDITEFTSREVQKALHDLEELGIANNDTALTAYVHDGVERNSNRRLDNAETLETALIRHLRETAPDLVVGETSTLHLRIVSQRLRDEGVPEPLLERVLRILRGLSHDGRDDGGAGNLDLRVHEMENARITLRQPWEALEETAGLRRDGARVLLKHLLDCLPPSSRGADLLASTTLGGLRKALISGLGLKSRINKSDGILNRSLMWLHEMEVIRLDKGLTIFRPAMTIRLEQEKPVQGFSNVEFAPLRLHYQNQILQIHVMAEYARKGLQNMDDADQLALDYFKLNQTDFIDRWMPERRKETDRQTTPESWHRIVEDLGNAVQKRIVADNRGQQNVLVLAGPGSGKTRALVHRIAYLVRVRRENPRGIIALAYNRHAAQEIRQRLHGLIGKEGRSVTIMTCHALAMRMVGASFSGRMEKANDRPDHDEFKAVLAEAVDLLNGKGLPEDEVDDQRERLLAGFRWILVDEYQDIDMPQYELISALAGRTIKDPDRKLTVFAVGDDDQNIYAFNGSSVEFIRRFSRDYEVKAPMHLVENYRSTKHIIAAANEVIQPASNRMKIDTPIRVNRTRDKEPDGGAWEALDPISKGRVQVLHCPPDLISQALLAVADLERLAGISPDWDWSRCAVIAREWKYLHPVRAYCEARGIPVQTANEESVNIWKLREVQVLVRWLDQRRGKLVAGQDLRKQLHACPDNVWRSLLDDALDTLTTEVGDETTGQQAMEWLAEWSREARRRQTGLLLLSAHRAKGLEFNHVTVLDGGWNRRGRNEDRDAARRLYYVAMTRARQMLSLVRFGPTSPVSHDLGGSARLMTEGLLNNQSVTVREHVTGDGDRTGLDRLYSSPELSDINLGFAGRLKGNRHTSIKAIADLAVGDPLKFQQSGDRWEYLDGSGKRVGIMARNFTMPKGYWIASASVYAVIIWKQNPESQDYPGVKRDRWEVVIPEIVYEPSP
ncbi:MAG: RecQ family ATP-dependent DNA helicase [Gammaproteobacteria bacterium]|nr:RecQ family ATP-dependent DNA helicase [Gammaproteobacteria bacterium]